MTSKEFSLRMLRKKIHPTYFYLYKSSDKKAKFYSITVNILVNYYLEKEVLANLTYDIYSDETKELMGRYSKVPPGIYWIIITDVSLLKNPILKKIKVEITDKDAVLTLKFDTCIGTIHYFITDEPFYLTHEEYYSVYFKHNIDDKYYYNVPNPLWNTCNFKDLYSDLCVGNKIKPESFPEEGFSDPYPCQITGLNVNTINNSPDTSNDANAYAEQFGFYYQIYRYNEWGHNGDTIYIYLHHHTSEPNDNIMGYRSKVTITGENCDYNFTNYIGASQLCVCSPESYDDENITGHIVPSLGVRYASYSGTNIIYGRDVGTPNRGYTRHYYSNGNWRNNTYPAYYQEYSDYYTPHNDMRSGRDSSNQFQNSLYSLSGGIYRFTDYVGILTYGELTNILSINPDFGDKEVFRYSSPAISVNDREYIEGDSKSYAIFRGSIPVRGSLSLYEIEALLNSDDYYTPTSEELIYVSN